MNSLFYIQYDPNTHNLTNLTSDNMEHQNGWYQVAISPARQPLAQSQYRNIKYNPVTKALEFPTDFDDNTNVINDNKDLINTVSSQAQQASKDVDEIKHRVAWNHLMSVYNLPDDFSLLKNDYGINSNGLNFNIADITKTGVYMALPWANVTAHDAPTGTYYNAGYVVKVYVVTDQFAVAVLTDTRGIWTTKFTVRGSINPNGWKQIVSF